MSWYHLSLNMDEQIKTVWFTVWCAHRKHIFQKYMQIGFVRKKS